MNDELVTSRWSDSSEESLQRRPSLWRRGTTERTTPQAEKGKVPLHRRIAKALGLKRDSKDKVDPNDSNITGIVSNPAADFDALGRPIRYPLSQQYKEPEEPEELALRIKSQEQLIATHRIFRGPVPRQPAPGVDPRTADEDAVALRGTLELAFLAPCEKKVLFLLRRSQRVSRFRPLLEPQNELLLVNTLDYDNILAAQTLVRELPDDERQLMWSNLHGQLLAHQSYILRLVLFHPEIRITTHTRGRCTQSQAMALTDFEQVVVWNPPSRSTGLRQPSSSIKYRSSPRQIPERSGGVLRLQRVPTMVLLSSGNNQHLDCVFAVEETHHGEAYELTTTTSGPRDRCGALKMKNERLRSCGGLQAGTIAAAAGSQQEVSCEHAAQLRRRTCIKLKLSRYE